MEFKSEEPAARPSASGAPESSVGDGTNEIDEIWYAEIRRSDFDPRSMPLLDGFLFELLETDGAKQGGVAMMHDHHQEV
jgi:hypothetical protein